MGLPRCGLPQKVAYGQVRMGGKLKLQMLSVYLLPCEYGILGIILERPRATDSASFSGDLRAS
jgi:hypothetical protein